MKKLNIAGAFLVLCCAVSVSYSHSVALFEAGGFRGWMAHAGVVAVEVTFLMGALNIVVARLKRRPVGAPAAMGGILGVILVSWSNIAAGWSAGITGILLGLVIPAALITAEAILSRAILQPKKEPAQVGESPAEPPKVDEPPKKATARSIRRPQPAGAAQLTAAQLDELKKWATEYQKQKNRPPSRRAIAQKAGVSEWQARKILESLEKQIS